MPALPGSRYEGDCWFCLALCASPFSSPSPPSQPPYPHPHPQTFEVQVPAGVQPGQPFALIANGQRVLVTCPATAGPGQRIRFQLPVHNGTGDKKGDVSVNAVKLSYAKDGWSRCLDPGDMKFHWVLNTSEVAEETKVRRRGTRKATAT